MADRDERIKIPLIEPASGVRKGQVEEFLEYHGGSGVQHFAVLTDPPSETLRVNAVPRLRGT